MHYRNGRVANNGDKIVTLNSDGSIDQVGILQNAVPGNDYCNGHLETAPPLKNYPVVCLCDALHVDDVAAILKEKALDTRPARIKFSIAPPPV